MEKNKSLMPDSRFRFFIFSAFVVGMAIIIFVQYNSSKNMDTLVDANRELLDELRTSNHLREIDRDILGVESRIRAAIATDDTSHLEGVEGKIRAVTMYLDSLDSGDADMPVRKNLERLHFLAQEKVATKKHLIELYFRTGRMDDTTSIGNPQARITSDEIAGNVHKIYSFRKLRMQEITGRINESGLKAKAYGNILIALLLLSAGLLCWYIINQFRSRTRLIDQLDRSEHHALEALGVKENFLANMSHEIRTPLNSILGFTTLLEKEKLGGRADKYVNSIHQAGENLLVIINDILDISKIEAGMMRIVNQPFSIRGLLHSLEILFSERIRAKQLGYMTKISADIPDILIGDATRLTQILVNLLGNAVKFSESGAILIDVGIAEKKDERISLRFVVKDQGIGIAPEELEHIFERFNQGDDSITRSYGGTGLGLSIVKDLVEIQQGNITVSSRAGVGTSFTFDIPYLIDHAQYAGKEVRDIEAKIDRSGKNSRILIVDDNAMNRDLMVNVLGYWGFSSAVAIDGLEAVEILSVKDFDLVLMDIQMPRKDGYSATASIRSELKSDVPIIAMTAHAMPGEREKCISVGMNDYISKPVNEQELLGLIEKLITGRPAAQREEEWSTFRYINLEYLKDIGKGNIAYERKVTGHFIESAPHDLDTLHSSLAGADMETLRKTAHNLRTTLGIMGLLPQTENLLDTLEFSEMDKKVFEHCIAVLEEIIREAMIEVKSYLKALPAV